MKKHFIHPDTLLTLTAIGGLALFIFLAAQVFPFRAVQFTIDREQAVAIARSYMTQLGYNLDGYRVSAHTEGPDQEFNYLQQQVGMDRAIEIARQEEAALFTHHWTIAWYKNVPRSAPQERFSACVSPQGRVNCFTHTIPRDAAPSLGAQKRLTQEEALQKAEEFLRLQGLGLRDYVTDEFTSQRYENRTDHDFRWTKPYDKTTGDVKLYLQVQGEEVSFFRQWFELPKEASLRMNERDSGLFILYTGSMVFFFLFSLIPIVFFLKKYHEGEVGVKTAFAIFVIVYMVMILKQINSLPIQAYGWQMGELSIASVAVVKLIFSAFIIVPFIATVAFASWSVGEALAREKWGGKLSALDAIINGRFKTLAFARSASRGYAFGFISLGLTTLLGYLCIHGFGAVSQVVGYHSTITLLIPMLAPLLSALSAALICELLFRLFANLWLFKTVKREWVTMLLTAGLFTLVAIPVWDFPVLLHPLPFLLLLLFANGLLFAYIFWRHDLVTVIFANMTLVGILTVLPIISNPAPSLRLAGAAAIVLLFSPLMVVALGYRRKEKFAYQPESMPAHIRRITERERMARELEIARQVQMKLLPKSSPIVPGCDVAGICIPAKEVGGDYYDFIQLGDNKLGIAVGDVSGKGVPAAIYMTLTKGVFQSHAESNISPRIVLTKVNSLLYRTIERGSFVSMFYAVIDLKNQRMRYARAGHNPAIYFNRSGNQFTLLESAGLALGLERGELFNQVIHEEEITVRGGDLLVFYTDGFTEAMNKVSEEFTDGKLLEVVNLNKHLAAHEIINAVQDEIKKFVGDYPQHDDMTMVVVKIV